MEERRNCSLRWGRTKATNSSASGANAFAIRWNMGIRYGRQRMIVGGLPALLVSVVALPFALLNCGSSSRSASIAADLSAADGQATIPTPQPTTSDTSDPSLPNQLGAACGTATPASALSAELPRQKPGDGCVPPLLCMGITGQVPAAESRPMRCTQPCKTDQDCDADGGGPLTGRCHPRTPGDVPIPAYCEIAP